MGIGVKSSAVATLPLNTTRAVVTIRAIKSTETTNFRDVSKNLYLPMISRALIKTNNPRATPLTEASFILKRFMNRPEVTT